MCLKRCSAADRVTAVYPLLSAIIFAAAALMVGSSASVAETSAELSIGASGIAFGDSLGVLCTVTAPPGTELGQPVSAGDPLVTAFLLRSRREDTSDDLLTVTFDLLTYALSPDTLAVGPLAIPYQTAAGDSGIAVSNIVLLPVTGLVDTASTQPPVPRPMSGMLSVRSRGIPHWLIALIIMALLLAAFVYWRARRTSLIEEENIPDEPIDEIARFEHIRSLRLHESGRLKELYSMVSDALRGFIHRNMNGRASYETTTEIIADLSASRDDDAIVHTMESLFRESDMVKFARFTPAVDSAATVVDRALDPVRTILAEVERERARRAEAEARKRAEPADNADQDSATAIVPDANTPEPAGKGG